MPTRRQVAVLGLGRFGQAVALELTRLGHDVLAVDRDERVVQSIADDVTHAVQADITDPDTLEALGLADFDTAIVAVSETLEASIMATVLLRRIGVRRIIAKAAHDLHGSILEQVGAMQVVYPERETGFRVAHSFHAPGVQDYLDAAPGHPGRQRGPQPLAGRAAARRRCADRGRPRRRSRAPAGRCAVLTDLAGLRRDGWTNASG